MAYYLIIWWDLELVLTRLSSSTLVTCLNVQLVMLGGGKLKYTLQV